METCKCATCGYEWKRGQDGSHSCILGQRKRIEELENYKAAFLAADAFIESHAADPDLTTDMLDKYSNYIKAKSKLPKSG